MSGTPKCLCTAVTPPSSSMMSEAVMAIAYANRRSAVNGLTKCAVDDAYDSRHLLSMLDKLQLLAALRAKGVQNVDVEKALDLPSSRVTEIFRALPDNNPGGKKERDLTYEEGVRLIRAFELERDPPVAPVPVSVLRLAVRHIALKLGAPLNEPVLHDLAEDLRAFSSFAADPTIRQSVEAAEGFFRALQSRRRSPEEEAQLGTDPVRNH